MEQLQQAKAKQLADQLAEKGYLATISGWGVDVSRMTVAEKEARARQMGR